MPTIHVESPSRLFIDGTFSGAVADCIANLPRIASEIQLALVAYDEALRAEHAAQIAALNQTHGEALAVEADKAAALKADRAGLQAELDANLAYQAQVLEKAAVVVPEAVKTGKFDAVLDLLAFAAKPLADKRRDEEAAKLRELEAEIAERRAKLGL
jgi:hypothetical protein